MSENRKWRWGRGKVLSGSRIPGVFFALLLVVGLVIVPDYGISTDERVQMRHSLVSLDYAATKLGMDWEPFLPDYDLEKYGARQYSMLYGMICTGVAETIGVERNNFRQQVLVRHYVAFLLFWLALLAFYRTLKFRFTGWQYPFLGMLFIVLCPRIFANAFYNPKDTILLDFYIYGAAALFYFLKQRNWLSLVLFSIATGAVLNTRLPALFLPLMTVVLLLAEIIQDRRLLRRNLVHLCVYALLSFVVFVALFPYLWVDTFARFAEVFSHMAKFDWDGHNLIFHEFILGTETPFWYIPAWIIVTLPLGILGLIFLGLFYTIRTNVLLLPKLKFWEDEHGLFDLAQLGLGIGPLLAVIILESNLYNGWRHLYFVYPALAYLAVVAWQRLRVWVKPHTSTVLGTLLAVNLGLVAIFMIQNHPHQQVYFNFLAGDNLAKRFDMDYWGLSYQQALQELARKTPPGEKAVIQCANGVGRHNFQFMPAEFREKLRYRNDGEMPDYYLTNFRRPGPHTSFFARQPPYHDRPYFYIRVAGEPIMAVFKVDKDFKPGK